MIAAFEHPNDETLRALSLGQLVDAEITRVSTHLSDCLSCCHRIDQLATDDQLITRLKASTGSGDVLVNATERRSAVRALRSTHEPKSEWDASLPIPKQIGGYIIQGEVG